MAWRRAATVLCAGAALIGAVACADPPNKEMDRAQGAIDAARAAGADQYATPEYSLATTALANAHDAVAAGDYRLALNHALASHEHAQNAARVTVETKARMRADLERLMSELDRLVDTSEGDGTAGPRGRAPRRPPAPLSDALGRARSALQEARAAVAAGDYMKATQLLEGVKENLEGARAEAGAAQSPQSSRR